LARGQELVYTARGIECITTTAEKALWRQSKVVIV